MHSCASRWHPCLANGGRSNFRVTGRRGRTSRRAFDSFIGSEELHSRVRSCTDCYLDLADFLVPVDTGGWLVHFLSDSQWVLHWLLQIGSGAPLVVVTDLPLGFEGADEPLDESRLVTAVCAESFSEFLYRFWIENEIWFALAYDRRPLTDEQRAYVEHYL